MEINEELIRLYDDFLTVGTITASVSSLDERGMCIIGIRPPAMGGVHKEKYMGIEKSKFYNYYTTENCHSFALYRLKEEWVEVAIKHKKALEYLT